MSVDTILLNETNYLFDCDFFSDDFDAEGNEEHLQRAEQLLNTYPWKDVFACWNSYLRHNCNSPEEVINFCNLFSYYGGQDNFIPDPYEFLGYIYYMVDINEYWDEAGDFLDGLSISILEKSGEISTTKNPYYQSWKDPCILEIVKKYKNK